MLIIFYIFLLYTGLCSMRVIVLNEENPSFAIHGVHLAQLEQIKITCDIICDFLLDFTQKDCVTESPAKVKNENAQNRRSGKKRRFCLDPLPFSIDGFEGFDDGASEWNCQVIPTATNFTETFHTCAFYVKKRAELFVRSSINSTNGEYALSFRVKQWTPANQSVLVVPGSPTVDMQIVLVRENTVAVIIANPEIQQIDSFMVMVPMDKEFEYEDECILYRPDITCDGKTSYSTYFGSSPAIETNKRYFIMQLRARDEVMARTTVMSISSDNGCSFCLFFGSDQDMDAVLYLDREQVLNSNHYPWTFDDPIENKSSQDYFLTHADYNGELVTVKVEGLEGGILQLTGSLHFNQTDEWCDFDVLSENLSFVEAPREAFRFDARCLLVQWIPNVSNNSDRCGFVLRTIPDEWVDPNPRGVCLQVINLTESDPQIIIHSANLYWAGAFIDPLCISWVCNETVEDCSSLIEFAVQCPWDELLACSQTATIEVNGRYSRLENCSDRISTLNQTLLITCRFFAENQIFLRARKLNYLRSSSVSISALKWINRDVDVYIFPSHLENTTLAYRLSAQERPLWITFPVSNMKSATVIRKFRVDHSNLNCEYQLFSGPPIATISHPERWLLTFRDSDPFVDQYLESSLFSVFVPPRCSPSILVEYITDYENKLFLTEDLTKKRHELCDGQMIIASNGYANPFEIPYMPEFSVFFLPTIWCEITCSSFPVKITVEVISLDGKQLELHFFDSDANSKEILVSPDAQTPFSETASNISRLLILISIAIASAANVLFLNSWNSKTHALSMKPLMERLHDRGHNVTIYTQTGVPIGKIGNKVNTLESLVVDENAKQVFLIVMELFWNHEMHPILFEEPWKSGYNFMEASTKDENLKRVLETKFDVVIIDDMFPPGQSSIAEYQKVHYGAKIATFPTTDSQQVAADFKGLGRNPVTIPNYHTKGYHTTYDPSDFTDRLHNVRDVIVEIFVFHFVCEKWMAKAGKLLGVQPTQHKMYSDSFYHFFDYPELLLMPTPKTAQVVAVGQNCQAAKPLDKELEDFVSNPKSKGTIYVAFGSIVNWKFGPPQMRHTFVKVFNKLTDYRVIWSYQDEVLTEANDHIKFLKWAPQNDILAHSKTVLFFTHGGIKSFKEGLCAGVPMLFLPFFADQPKNALLAKHWGIAQTIYKKNVTEIELESKILAILNNPEYGTRGKKFRSLYLERLVDPLDLGVFHLEKILKHSDETKDKYLLVKTVFLTYAEFLYFSQISLFLLSVFLLSK